MDWRAPTIWLISFLSIALVLIRPKRLPEAWWAVIGACTLLIFRLISPIAALRAVGKGLDVYLFLAGMMMISELARREGVFDWVARHAVNVSRGSAVRLFFLIYCIGTVVTIFLSNDATAVVLTPAVLAAVRAAEAEPLPYLLVCAFIANAASFVLPISNPANLVVYNGEMPPLGRWILTFGLPSLLAIGATFFLLRWLANSFLRAPIRTRIDEQALSKTGKLTLYGIAFLTLTLMTASVLNLDLGAPTCITGLAIAAAISVRDRGVAKDLATEISWSVLPLVAGLFVIVDAMNEAGALAMTVHVLQRLAGWRPLKGALTASFGVAFLSNLMNNLPSGLIAGAAVKGAHAGGSLREAILIGVDLGPNLSITGSLATILWLIAIRREGQNVAFWKFLKWGLVAMPPALAAAIVGLRG
jgi:arsenical pump membrane protein